MGFGKRNFKFGGFVENNGNKGRKFLSPDFLGGRFRDKGLIHLVRMCLQRGGAEIGAEEE